MSTYAQYMRADLLDLQHNLGMPKKLCNETVLWKKKRKTSAEKYTVVFFAHIRLPQCSER